MLRQHLREASSTEIRSWLTSHSSPQSHLVFWTEGFQSQSDQERGIVCVDPSSQHSTLLSSQELCKKLHAKIESVDEERYDTEVKLQKTTKEVSLLRGDFRLQRSLQPVPHAS